MFTIQDSPWDTHYFGVSCAKVELAGLLTEQEKAVFLEQIEPYQYITVCNPDAFAENNAFLHNIPGSQKTDTNIRLQNEAPYFVPKGISPQMELAITDTLFDMDIQKQVPGIFSASRFYHDPNISKEKADGIYISWLQNARKRKSKYFCTCRIDGTFAGLILFQKDAESLVRIELIFTSTSFRHCGVGSAMMYRLFDFCNQNNITRILVGTQERNQNALQFYRRHGFIDINKTHIFHIWKD